MQPSRRRVGHVHKRQQLSIASVEPKTELVFLPVCICMKQTMRSLDEWLITNILLCPTQITNDMPHHREQFTRICDCG